MNETTELKCPECGAEPDTLFIDRGGEIVGCEFCLKKRYWYEVEVDEA